MKWDTIQWKWSNTLKSEHHTSFWQKFSFIDQNDFMVRVMNIRSQLWLNVFLEAIPQRMVKQKLSIVSISFSLFSKNLFWRLFWNAFSSWNYARRFITVYQLNQFVMRLKSCIIQNLQEFLVKWKKNVMNFGRAFQWWVTIINWLLSFPKFTLLCYDRHAWTTLGVGLKKFTCYVNKH